MSDDLSTTTLTKKSSKRNIARIAIYVYLDYYAEFIQKLKEENIGKSTLFKAVIAGVMKEDKSLMKFLRKKAVNPLSKQTLEAKKQLKKLEKDNKKKLEQSEEYMGLNDEEISGLFDEIEILEESKNERV